MSEQAEQGDNLQPTTPAWVKPEITSFAPAKAAEGIFYLPTDGLSNLTA